MFVSDVEANVPLPSHRAPVTRLPFAGMTVGDSFLVSLEPHEATPDTMKRLRGKLVSAASRAAHKFGTRYSIRKIDEETFRVWRVA